MKRRLLLFVFAALAGIVLLSACEDVLPEEMVEISDFLSGGGIYTTAELISFFESGLSDTATLGASIDLGSEILRLEADRGPITIEGNGYGITGNGDCVIRMGDGCTLRLVDVGITGGRNGIGCLGDAAIGGNATINSVAHCMTATGDIVIEENSKFVMASNVGCGLKAKGLTLLSGSSMESAGTLGGLNITEDDLILGENAALSAITEENYNALKCEGTLVMSEGASLAVTNNGEYHGAELNELSVAGVATLNAVGGSKGVGVFLFEQEDDIYLIGSCTPELRFEVGDGSVTFVADASEIPEPGTEGGEESGAEPEGVPSGES